MSDGLSLDSSEECKIRDFRRQPRRSNSERRDCSEDRSERRHGPAYASRDSERRGDASVAGEADKRNEPPLVSFLDEEIC